MNALDAALQANTPVVVVPRFEELEPLDRNGHRFLVADDGLWLEARRSWCHIVWPLQSAGPGVAMPYGKLKRVVSLSFGRFPSWFLSRFIEDAVRMHPVETAAVGIWNSATEEIRYAPCEPIRQGVGHITSRWPTLTQGEEVVIDAHSHGPLPAFFSGQDRLDMGANVVLACVVGATPDRPEVVVSLFAAGKEIRVELPPEFARSPVDDVDAGSDATESGCFA